MILLRKYEEKGIFVLHIVPLLLAASIVFTSHAGVTGLFTRYMNNGKEVYDQAKIKSDILSLDIYTVRTAETAGYMKDKDGNIIGFLPKGATATLLPDGEIRSGDCTGYIEASLSSSMKDFIDQSKVVTPNSFQYIYQNDTGDEKIGLFRHSYIVTGEGERYAVTLRDGSTGYVDKTNYTSVSDIEAYPMTKEEMFRDRVIYHAFSLEEKVPYVWGGKPKVDENGNITIGKGLDCSGFIKYCILQAAKDTGYDINADEYLSTKMIADKREATETPVPGDLGLRLGTGTFYEDIRGNIFFSPKEAKDSSAAIRQEIANTRAARTPDMMIPEEMIKAEDETLALPDVRRHSDHVGIYLGKDNDGNPVFIHENGTDNNISINAGCFTVTKDLFAEKKQGEDKEISK